MTPVLVLREVPELSEWLARRRDLGQDVFDEMWEGVYHVAPVEPVRNGIVATEIQVALHGRVAGLRGTGPFNLGEEEDYRVPDGGWISVDAEPLTFMATAVVVLEVLSPHDESFRKLPFYAARGVAEVLIAHPLERWVRCYVPDGCGSFRPSPEDGSAVFRMAMADLTAAVQWP